MFPTLAAALLFPVLFLLAIGLSLLASFEFSENARLYIGYERRHIFLENKSHELIVEVRVADDDHTDNWQHDVLQTKVIHPDHNLMVEIGEDRNDNCLVDVKVVLDDGKYRVFRRSDVCARIPVMVIR